MKYIGRKIEHEIVKRLMSGKGEWGQTPIFLHYTLGKVGQVHKIFL